MHHEKKIPGVCPKNYSAEINMYSIIKNIWIKYIKIIQTRLTLFFDVANNFTNVFSKFVDIFCGNND